MKAVLAAVALAGCNLAFDIHDVTGVGADAAAPPDAPVVVDAPVGHADSSSVLDGIVSSGSDAVACTGHDEDGDGLGDACDPCPAQTTNTDGDGDGVGDKCDPFPNSVGDSRVFFDGFDTQMAGWTANPAGSWTYGGDTLDHTPASAVAVTMTMPMTVANATVDAIFKYALTGGSAYAGIQLVTDQGVVVQCLVTPSKTSGVAVEMIDNGLTTLPTELGVQTGVMRMILTHLSDGSFRCTVSQGTASVMLSGGVQGGATTSFGLYTFDSTMTASSIAVFTR